MKADLELVRAPAALTALSRGEVHGTSPAVAKAVVGGTAIVLLARMLSRKVGPT